MIKQIQLFICLFAYISCSAQKSVVEKVEFRADGCYGTCPIFTMTINKDRSAEYNGINFNDLSGKYTGTIKQKTYDSLVSLLKEKELLKLNNKYEDQMPDMPGFNLKVKYSNGKVKEIYNYGKAGASLLKEIKTFMFNLRNTQEWKYDEKTQVLTHEKKAKVDFDAYEKLVNEVKEHRKSRMLDLNQFLAASREKGVIILDTRSDSMYLRKHIKGAIHLNFSDFTQQNLKNLIPNPETKILIYCNNNFDGDETNFASKIVMPKVVGKDIKPITLALNIPTYINLYGYGYRNVYELSELVTSYDIRVKYEGTEMK